MKAWGAQYGANIESATEPAPRPFEQVVGDQIAEFNPSPAQHDVDGQHFAAMIIEKIARRVDAQPLQGAPADRASATQASAT